MANEPTKEKEITTMAERLGAQGWPAYYHSVVIEYLGSAEGKNHALGFWDALGRRQVVIVAPIDELIQTLTDLAKKQAKKI